MNRSKFLPLTETTYLILIALLQPGHGYYVMQRVEELSNGKVRVAAGTMYGAIENLLKLNWIVSVPSEDARRKMYQTSKEGIDILRQEAERLYQMIAIAEQYNLCGGENHD